MRRGDSVFVDTGAWIALAITADPYHERANLVWDELLSNGARLKVSVPVILETFTFLERNTNRAVALAWKDSLTTLPWFEVIECKAIDVEQGWKYFRRRDLHKLSAVDATSFAIMERRRIRTAFAFDHHFSTVGYRLIG